MNTHRSGLGRQRDLAGAGRRRAAGGVPAGLCDVPAGALCADHRDAAGADLPRRRLRVPLARPRIGNSGPSVRGGSDRGGVGAGPRAWRVSSRGSRWQDRAYAGGWFDWLTPFSLLRRGADRGLRAAWRGLADHEERGHAAGAMYRWPWPRHRLRFLHRRVSLGTPFLGPTHCQRWFSWPQHRVHRAGAAPGGRAVPGSSSRRCAAARARAIPAGAPALPRHPTPALGSACFPTSCRARLRSGRPPRRTTARFSCWSEQPVLIPIILAYTGYSYWVFRGKVPAPTAIIDAGAAAVAVVPRPVGRRRRRYRARGLRDQVLVAGVS